MFATTGHSRFVHCPESDHTSVFESETSKLSSIENSKTQSGLDQDVPARQKDDISWRD